RLATTDSFDDFFVSQQIKVVPIRGEEAVEESFFLGLRLNGGIRLEQLRRQFGNQVSNYLLVIEELVSSGLLSLTDDAIRLTPRGRLLSNEVFSRFIGSEEGVTA